MPAKKPSVPLPVPDMDRGLLHVFCKILTYNGNLFQLLQVSFFSVTNYITYFLACQEKRPIFLKFLWFYFQKAELLCIIIHNAPA